MMKQCVSFAIVIGCWTSPPSHSLMMPAGNLRRSSENCANIMHDPHRMRRRTTQCNMIPLPIPASIAANPTITMTIYALITNFAYLARRAHIRNMSKRKLLQIRLDREGCEIPLYITNLLAWQIFVTSIFPVLEPMSRLFGYISFYYFYPNANGMGIIFEPLSVQSLPMPKRAKSQIRCDWHKFSFNVGAVGRDGYRHPPAVERNVPHIDAPKLGWKHWPWRRQHNVEKT